MVAADEYREAFELFDTENEGGLDCTTTGNLLRAMGFNPSEDEVAALFKQVAQGGKASCDDVIKAGNEFERTFDKTKAEQECVTAFRAYDRESNGMVAVAEVTALLKNLPTRVEEEELDDILKDIDPKETGMIDYAAFSKMLFTPLPDGLLPQHEDSTSLAYSSSFHRS